MVDRGNYTETAGSGRHANQSCWSDRATSCASPARQASTAAWSSIEFRPIFLLAERLVQIWSSYSRKLDELRESRLKLGRARAYLASPGCNWLLGRAYLEVLARAHEKHLDDLRRLRRQAWELADLVEAMPVASHAHRTRSGGEARAGLGRSRS